MNSSNISNSVVNTSILTKTGGVKPKSSNSSKATTLINTNLQNNKTHQNQILPSKENQSNKDNKENKQSSVTNNVKAKLIHNIDSSDEDEGQRKESEKTNEVENGKKAKFTTAGVKYIF